jgi:Spy/CpxP family protein refolding chaperone
MSNTAMTTSMACSERRVTVSVVVLFTALATAACGGAASVVRPATTGSTSDDDPAAGLKEYHRYHHHGGVTLFVAMSLDTLAVSPEQRAAVTKIALDLHSQLEPARVAEQGLVVTLADGLAAGNLDPAKVDAAMVRVMASAAAVHAATASSLNELHTVLTPPQRAALVDKVEAHWAVWQRANDEETGAGEQSDGHLAMLIGDVDLSEDQIAKMRAGLGERIKGSPRLDPQQVAVDLRSFGDAFRSETFDARKLATVSDVNTHVIGWGASHLANFVETALLVLTADQRAQLAQHLREHAAHGLMAQGSSQSNE